MDKLSYTTILQASLWAFEGLNELEILNMLTPCDPKLIKMGIALNSYLNKLSQKSLQPLQQEASCSA